MLDRSHRDRPTNGLWSASSLVLLIAGCAHGDPFPSGEVPDNGPKTSLPPIQLTYHVLQDLAPAWEADESGLVYSFQLTDPEGGRVEFDGDRCIGLLPPGGGVRLAQKCIGSDVGHDSVDAFTAVAAGPDGRYAWVEQHGTRVSVAPSNGAIAIGSLARNDPGTSVRSLPYLAPTGLVHVTATHLGWLDANTLVYVASNVQYVRACQGCRLDTLTMGLEVARLNLAASPAAVEVLPGTAQATSVWPARDGSAVYFTIMGDSRVFRRILGSGATETVHDFGPLGIARDASLVDSVLVAVVGGFVSFETDPVLGPLQRDSGGEVFRVDLRTGVELPLPLPDALVSRHAALSPSATRIVAEAYAPPPAGLRADLWLLTQP